MTATNNGWPDKPGVPLNPEKDGWHWLVQKNQEFPEVWEWNAGPLGAYWAPGGIGAWLESKGDGQPEGMAKWYRYLSPVPLPAEATALQKRVSELEEVLREILRCTEKHVFGDECKAQRDKARAALEGKKVE